MIFVTSILFKYFFMYFREIKHYPNGAIDERSFSNPHPLLQSTKICFAPTSLSPCDMREIAFPCYLAVKQMRTTCDPTLNGFCSSLPNNPLFIVTWVSQEINYETYRAPVVLFLQLWECQPPPPCVILPTVCFWCDCNGHNAIDGYVKLLDDISWQINMFWFEYM